MRIDFPDFYKLSKYLGAPKPFNFSRPPEGLLTNDPITYPSVLEKFSWVNVYNANTKREVTLNPFQYCVLAAIWGFLFQHHWQDENSKNYHMKYYNTAMEGISWFAQEYPEEYSALLR